MLIELRSVKPMSKGKSIRALQYKGFINKYVNEFGYICYKEEELQDYRRYKRRGRPPKLNKEQK